MSLSDAAAAAVAAYTLDEASGTRFDSVNSLDLTDFNTVGSAAGKFSDAADFESGSSEYLQRSADDADLSGGDVYLVFRLWVKLESKSDLMCAFGKMGDSTGTNREYMLRYDNGGDRFVWFVFDSMTAVAATANNFGSPSTGTLYLVHCGHNPVTNEIWISVNAGTRDTASHATGIFDGPSRFTVGGQQTGSTPSELASFWDGLIDDLVVMRDYDFTTSDATDDYNGGTGVAFASWAGGADVTVALAGQGATASAGTISPEATVATSGESATGSAGTLAALITLALAGEASTGTAGSAAPTTTMALSGQGATASPGTVTAPGDATTALSGQEMTASAGTMTASGGDATAGGTVRATVAGGSRVAATVNGHDRVAGTVRIIGT